MPWYDSAVYSPPGSDLLGHGGGTAGFATFIGFDKLQRRGIVILSNQVRISFLRSRLANSPAREVG